MTMPTLEQQTALHRAVARYQVVVSRMVPRKARQLIASDMTYDDAKSLQERADAQLAIDEPEWAGCMCRSLALVELTNGSEVARVLGHGPGFDYDAAVRSVESFLQGLEGAEPGADGTIGVGLQGGVRVAAQRFREVCLQVKADPASTTTSTAP